MKKVIKLPLILMLALTAFIAVGVFSFSNVAYAYDEYDEPTNTYISSYSVRYDIKSNRSMSVEEDITVSFDRRSGIVKYIPVNAGEQVKNIKVCELAERDLADVYYRVSYEDEAIFLDIGDYTVKNNKHTYRISYEYCLTKAQEGKNLLALTPIGADWPCAIENISINMTMPKGYISGSALCFVNRYGKINDITYKENIAPDGRTTLQAFTERVEKGSEVRLDLSFEDGVLSTYSDSTPYLLLIPAIILIALIFILKFFVFNKNYLTPVVNYEAPDKMDPLIMGKLIDNRVNNEDITSLIFYWANKGYLKINLDDKDNPTLIRIIQTLPETCPDYERLMFYSLFQTGDIVKTSQLENKFYKTTEKVTAMVNKRTKGLYDSKSFVAAGVFTALGALLLGIAPMIFAFVNVSSKLLFWPALAVIIPVFIINVAAQALLYNKLKFKKRTLILGGLGIALLCVVTGLLYVLVVPACIFGTDLKIVLFIVSCPIFTCSVLLIIRTKEYTEKLNDIVGFKNFILLAEKDQLEMMLEDDPQFYYHVLPYAQVLGVTDKWENKFANITVQPPQWVAGNAFTAYVEFAVINRLIRSSMGRISSGMVSRPSSSGASGGNHGGHFGGFSGGGHGGGGGHFR